MKRFFALCSLLFALCLLPKLVWADQPIELIKTLCMPEKGIQRFSVSTQEFYELAKYLQFGRGDKSTTKEEREKILEKHGLIVPNDFSFECRLHSHAYKIYGHRPELQDRGMCGGDPRIVLSLARDGVLILDKVFLEKSCLSGYQSYFVKDFSIDEFIPGWGGGQTYLTLSDGQDEEFILFKPGQPLTQSVLNCMESKNYLKSNAGRALFESCLTDTKDK
jgi:hypothetical protein